MTAPYTYNQLINWFSSFAANHYQLNYFGHGDLWEAMESNQAAHKLFPILWVNPVSSSVEFPYLKTRFQILCMDLVNTEESNETEVLSDMQLIMSDLKATLDAPAYQNLFWVEKSASITPFTEKFSGRVTGWMMEVDIKVKWQKDNCSVPLSGAPSGDNVCRPVIIYDSNGAVVATVASGGSYIITACSDATAVLKDTAGNTILTEQIPSGASENITAPDGTINLVNTDGDPVSTQTVRSNQTKSVTLANVAWTDSDGSSESTPYTDPIVCTPQVKSLFSKFTWESGDDTTSLVTIDADSAGTYTSSSQDGASGTITYSKNGGAYAAFSNPTSYANGDTIQLKRTVTTSLGWAKISGTYV